jgi:hypothetical protein
MSDRSPPASAAFMSPSRTPLKGCVVLHSGCFGANAFTRSRAKASWKDIGCSDHRVPSLSKTAIRSATGTKSGLPSDATRFTKSTIARFDATSFHDASGSAAADVATADPAR